MYTIGQFSRIGMISPKTLRFYDEIGLLKPAEVDKFTQYRYYSADQVADVLLISEMKEYGFSLEEIGILMNSKDAGIITRAMTAKLEDMGKQLEKLKASRTLLERRIKRINEGSTSMISSMDYRIELKEKPVLLVAGLKRRIAIEGINGLLGELFRKVNMLGIQPTGPVTALYDDIEFNPEDFQVEECVPVNRRASCSELDFKEIGGGLYACTLHVGPYHLLGNGYAVLMDWIQEKGLKLLGGSMETYLVGPENTSEAEKYVTEICMEIETL